MGALEVGKTLVEMVNQGKEQEAAFIEKYYSEDIVSVEGSGSDEMPARFEGMDAIRGKLVWWYDNNTVHSTGAVGPFIGNREDQFVIHYTMDLTPKEGERMQMIEVGIYTTVDDKITQEEYLYLV